MIERRQLSEIGETVKPHGIKGEISATIDAGIDITSLKCIVLDIDGIYVPFFLNSYRSRGSEAVLLSIDGINDENEAAKICGQPVYALTEDVPNDEAYGEDGFYMSDLIGFQLKDSDGEVAGTITGYDDSTSNILLIIEDKAGVARYVPMADELVEEFDPESRTIMLNLPKGLFEL